MAVRLGLVLVLLLIGCSGAADQQSGLGSYGDAVAWFNSNGFADSVPSGNSTLDSWTGDGRDGATGSVSGTGANATKVSLTVPIADTDLAGNFLDRFAPGSRSLLDNVVTQTRESGAKDQSNVISGRDVEVRTTGDTSSGYVITLTVS